MPSPFTSRAPTTTCAAPSLVFAPSAEKLGVTVDRSTLPPSCGRAACADAPSGANATVQMVASLSMAEGIPAGLHHL